MICKENKVLAFSKTQKICTFYVVAGTFNHITCKKLEFVLHL